MNSINYKHLYYFWIVAKEGGIARASESLHLTPQTISGQLRLLEDSLGTELFERSGKRLILTPAGEIAMHYAEEIFLIGAELKNVITNQQGDKPLSLCVGVTDAVPKLIAHVLIQPALKGDSAVRMKCYEDKLEVLLADLALHKLDVIISDRMLPNNSHIKAYNHRLGESKIVLFGNKQLVKRYKKGFPKSLNSAPLLLPTFDSAVRAPIEQWFRECNIRPDVICEFEDSALMKAFGQGGVGLFPGPEVIQNEIMRQYEVFPLGILDTVTEQFYAISADRKLKHPSVVIISDIAKHQIFN